MYEGGQQKLFLSFLVHDLQQSEHHDAWVHLHLSVGRVIIPVVLLQLLRLEMHFFLLAFPSCPANINNPDAIKIDETPIGRFLSAKVLRLLILCNCIPP